MLLLVMLVFVLVRVPVLVIVLALVRLLLLVLMVPLAMTGALDSTDCWRGVRVGGGKLVLIVASKCRRRNLTETCT